MGAYWFIHQKEGTRSETTVYGNKYVRDRIGKMHYIQMDTSGFSVTPGHVMMDVNDPLEESAHPVQTSESYIKKGCTLLVVKHLVSSIRHYRELYDQLLKKLEPIPVPYMVTPVVPAHLLRPELVRYFSRKGAPFLCVEVKGPEELRSVTWEWIVQAQSHKRIPLTIIVKDGENTSVDYTDLWDALSRQYGIIRLTDIQEDEWLTSQNLRDSGIYPNRGDFIYGGCADYNLYRQEEGSTFDEEDDFRYHNAVPDVTVVSGKVVQVNQTLIDYTPQSHVKVNVHKHFV
ncbi:hypothetical protein LCM20_07120 [Halobacillus litoralis]|uniref:hypothetical protein n=1 Tax=Halobacillus litoralis TaxID=45668 RepID=UPI001CD20BD5|nr:hypothetical protein [Halobacillus litoralis]MCA0970355.1 hypothetical protein [Halobacillus litoralis]